MQTQKIVKPWYGLSFRMFLNTLITIFLMNYQRNVLRLVFF